jgi:hypothetical protein
MIVIALVAMIAVFGGGAYFGYTILKPLVEATAGTKSRTRFYLCDFFTLSVLVVIPIAFFSQVYRNTYRRDMSVVNVALGILIAVFVYMWWRVAAAMTRAGVVSSGKRVVMLGMLMPMVVIGSSLVVPVWIVTTFSAAQFSGVEFLFWLATSIVIPITAILGRRVTQWVVTPDSINDVA